jgi:hydrogenase maturation protease
MTRVIVYGCGRAHRRDDQAGLLVARQLARAASPNTEVRASQAPGADLLTDLEALPAGAATRINLADSSAQGEHHPEQGGEPKKRPAPAAAPPPGPSAHTLNVNTALDLGRRLGLLPPDVWLYVLGGADFGYGSRCSPAVAAAVPRLARQVRDDIADWLRRHSEPVGATM